MLNKTSDHKLLLKAQALKANLRKRKIQKVSRLNAKNNMEDKSENSQQYFEKTTLK